MTRPMVIELNRLFKCITDRMDLPGEPLPRGAGEPDGNFKELLRPLSPIQTKLIVLIFRSILFYSFLFVLTFHLKAFIINSNSA